MNIMKNNIKLFVIVLLNIFMFIKADKEYIFHENGDPNIPNYDKNVFEGIL